MRILATMPGQFGDILLATLTVRAIAEWADAPVDFKISHHYDSLAPLLAEQPYIGKVIATEWNLADTGPVYTAERWIAGDPRPWEPLSVPEGYDKVAHLQYRGWPTPTCIAANAAAAEEDLGLEPGTLHPDPCRPWIRTAARSMWEGAYAAASWRHADYAKLEFLRMLGDGGLVVYVAAPTEEIPDTIPVPYVRANWRETAATIRDSYGWVGCQTAAWIIAAGMHKPCRLIEPDKRRWAAEFWVPTPECRRADMAPVGKW